MRILALDLATNCGYAFNDAHGCLHCGTWVLATEQELKAARKQRMNRRLDPRVTALYEKIHTLQRENAFNVVTFEDVEFGKYTLQCQLWASLRAALWLGCFQTKPIFDAVPVATLKKFATGHGGATKEMMVSSIIKQDANFALGPDDLTARFGVDIVDDNAVDAMWLWKRAHQLFSRFK